MNEILITNTLDPCYNLAVEEYFFDTHKEGVMLYLWQNERTVVIGRNQSAWRECRTELLEKEGITLVRRPSGGGAVFHDVGNLNFTFITDKASYDLKRQLSVLVNAVGSLGVKAKFSGRNDIITEDGAKFSGNAFRHSRNADLHHGTLLIDVDMTKLSGILNPSKAKLAGNAVDSVRSRVVNLHSLAPCVTVDTMKYAIIQAFVNEYGESKFIGTDTIFEQDIAPILERQRSWEWRFGKTPKCDASLGAKLSFGEIELALTIEGGRIKSAECFSDAMDEEYILSLPQVFVGLRYDANEMADAVLKLGGEHSAELSSWLRKQ